MLQTFRCYRYVLLWCTVWLYKRNQDSISNPTCKKRKITTSHCIDTYWQCPVFLSFSLVLMFVLVFFFPLTASLVIQHKNKITNTLKNSWQTCPLQENFFFLCGFFHSHYQLSLCITFHGSILIYEHYTIQNYTLKIKLFVMRINKINVTMLVTMDLFVNLSKIKLYIFLELPLIFFLLFLVVMLWQ